MSLACIAGTARAVDDGRSIVRRLIEDHCNVPSQLSGLLGGALKPSSESIRKALREHGFTPNEIAEIEDDFFQRVDLLNRSRASPENAQRMRAGLIHAGYSEREAADTVAYAVQHGLSARDVELIREYTHMGYMRINKVLRHPNLSRYGYGDELAFVYQLNLVLSRLPTRSGVSFRGISPRTVEQAAPYLKVGNVIREKTFVSSDISANRALIYANFDQNRPGYTEKILLEIRGKSGRKVGRFYDRKNVEGTENEVLFPPDLALRVESVEKRDSIWHVMVEEVVDPI